MTKGSLPGLISQPSKIFKSYQIQMQNVNFTCITIVQSEWIGLTLTVILSVYIELAKGGSGLKFVGP